MIMYPLAVLFAIGMLIGSFWSRFWIPLVYASSVTLFASFCIFLDWSGRSDIPKTQAQAFLTDNWFRWRTEELAIIRKYHIFIRYSISAKIFSCTLNAFRLSCFAWVPWMLWSHSWILGALLVLFYLASGGVALRWDPMHFLPEGVRRGGRNSDAFAYELASLQRINDIIWARPSDLSECEDLTS